MNGDAPQVGDGRIPLALVAGFLGAGKTTFLRRYAQRSGRRVVFLINEFAVTDVDTPLLAEAGARALGISGGSIFCHCKATEFISVLSALPERFPDVEGVVVEASGMADPSAAQGLLDASGLADRYRHSGTLTLVDPGSLHKVLDTLPAAERQVAAADAVVLGKVDLHPEPVLAAAEALVRRINPWAPLRRAAHGACDLDPLALGEPRWVAGELAACADPALVAVVLPCPGRIEAAALAAALSALGGDLYRAKGFLLGREGWCYLDWAAGRLTLRPSAPAPAGVAAIAHPRAGPQLEDLAERLRQGAFAA